MIMTGSVIVKTRIWRERQEILFVSTSTSSARQYAVHRMARCLMRFSTSLVWENYITRGRNCSIKLQTYLDNLSRHYWFDVPNKHRRETRVQSSNFRSVMAIYIIEISRLSPFFPSFSMAF